MSSAPRVSIVIPLHRLTPQAARCIAAACEVARARDEVVVVSDQPVEGLPPGARLILTGTAGDTSPAEKRDVALAEVRAPVCGFLDDDAYPAPDWIERALERLRDPAFAAVGGPGVTPPGSPFRERLSGAFYESRLGSGGLRYRFAPVDGVRDVDDFPAYNLFVRTEALRTIGGWNSKLYGGEDTKVCLELVRRGLRIVYDPAVIVYHHRRPVFGAMMRQVANVGRHRGFFVRAFPQTSARALYFAPSALLIATPLVASIGLRGIQQRRRLRAATAAAVGIMWAVGALEGHGPLETAALPAALVAGHGAYGAGFLRGIFSRDIVSM